MKQQSATKQSSTLTPAPPVGLILQRQCACGQHTIGGSTCGECNKKQQTLQRRPAYASEHTSTTETVPPIVHETLRSPGQPLDAGTRSFMESRFDHDFSQVRVHTDARAAESARAVNALAYTVGRDIAFGTGRYAPGTTDGKQLLAHELAHVIQQGPSAQMQNAALELGAPADIHEQEAEATAKQVARGEKPTVRQSLAGGHLRRLQRHPSQDTHAGLFELTRHKPIDAATKFSPQSQYDVRLEFLPYNIVDCEEVALTQTAYGYTGGTLAYASDARKNRSLTAAEGQEGLGIDRLSGRKSPLYGVLDTGATDTNAHFGSHTPGKVADRAWLEDAPGYDGSTPASSRPLGLSDSTHFQTCAICNKGTDKSAYYGCVSWGYEIDASDKFTEDKFERVSKGTPSADFLAAAKKWNAQTVPAATDDLPLPGHSTRNTHMTVADLDAEIKSLDTKLKGLAAGDKDIPQVTFELKVLRDIREAIKYNEDQGYISVEVKMIQEKVGAKQDGEWGYDTIRRIKIWQARHGLPTDGRVGPTTYTRMGLHRVGDYPTPDTSPTAERSA